MKVNLQWLAGLPANRWRIALADPQTVARYVRMAAFSEAPPIVIAADGTILDGIHRVAVGLKMGRQEIEVRLKRAAAFTE